MSARVLSVAFLLFGSGACALIYQVVWLRELRMVFGTSTAASATVLAIFMGGLGLGGIFWGRRADNHGRPLLLYAHLELAIAGFAMTTPFLVLVVRHVYIWLGGEAVMGTVSATLVRLVLSALTLGLPTFLMGGTLPAAVRAVEDASDAGRQRMALLYGLNTLGAVAGVALATFFMLEIFGARSSLWLSCLVNGLIGLAARALSRSRPPQEAALKEVPPPQLPEFSAGRPDEVPTPPGLVFLAAGIVGFAFMLMELVWYRMLSPLLGGSTYTFGLILAVALSGIGVGGAIYALQPRSTQARWYTFTLTCGLEAFFLAVPYALGDRVAVFAALLRPLGQIGLAGHVIGWSLITTIVVLPAAIVSGYQFPLLISLLGKGDQKIGQHIGLTYAWNTGGAIIGSLAGGFLLLPLLTAPGSWKGTVLLLVLLGVAAGISSLRGEKRKRFLILPSLALAMALLLLASIGPTAAWRHSPIGAGRVDLTRMTRNGIKEWIHKTRWDTVWQNEGREVSLGLSAADGLAFIVNGKIDGNAKYDAPTQVMVSLVGAILHPAPKTAMVIGLGTGSSAGWLAEVDTIKQVDVAELEPGILEVARRCAPVNRDVLSNPKVRMILADAREVLLTASGRYDLIVSEPSNPYRAGVASLYTQEFYQAVADRLAPGGIFSQWVQAYEVDTRTVRTIFATLASVFPQVEIWQTKGNDMLLVCSIAPRIYSVTQLRQRLKLEPFRTALLVSWGVTDLEGFFSRFVARPSLTRELAKKELRNDWINTDDRMLVEFGFARTVGREKTFTLTDLVEVARKSGENRPPVSQGEPDWEGVDENRIRMYVWEGLAVPDLSWLSPDQRRRAEAFRYFLTGDLRAARDHWKQQPRLPEHPLELALMAESLADEGDDRTRDLLKKLRPLWPVEADAILSRFYWRSQQPDQALEAFQFSFERLRTNPWPYGVIMARTLELSFEMVKKDPNRARRFHDILMEPFAVAIMNEKRLLFLLDIADDLGNEEVVKALQSFEPDVPWRKDFLLKRQSVYRKTDASMAHQSEKDLIEFFMEESVRITRSIE